MNDLISRSELIAQLESFKFSLGDVVLRFVVDRVIELVKNFQVEEGRKPLTVGDVIRAMTDEALTNILASIVVTGACNDMGIPGKRPCPHNCEDCILSWLKQVAP